MAFAILRTSKLKTWGEIGGSLSHTYRTRHTPNADPDRLVENSHSHQSTQAVKDDIANRLPEKRRSDAVLCVEHLITASPEWDGWRTDREEDFFKRSKAWLESTYGKDNLIGVSIHRDETTPHLIAYVVPLDESTGRLNCKKWLGGRKKLSAMQTSFANKVENLGLERGLEGSKAEHTTIKEFYAEVAKREPIEPIEVPKKGFTEFQASYDVRVAEAVEYHIEKSTSHLKLENIDLKKTIATQKHKIGELQYKVGRYQLFEEYARAFPGEEKRLNNLFKQRLDEKKEAELEAEKTKAFMAEVERLKKQNEPKPENVTESKPEPRPQPRLQPRPQPKRDDSLDFGM